MHRTVKRHAAVLGICVSLASTVVAPVYAADAANPLTELVQRFTAAQTAMDVPQLAALTADNYVEISPLGDVDPRDKMLGFYKKDDKRPPLPAVALDEVTTRQFGDTAVVTAKLSFTRTVGGQARSVSMRAGYVAVKTGGSWKLVSSQYTPMRPPANPG